MQRERVQSLPRWFPDGRKAFRRNPLCELFHGFTFHKHDGARSKGGSSTIEKGGGGRRYAGEGVERGTKMRRPKERAYHIFVLRPTNP